MTVAKKLEKELKKIDQEFCVVHNSSSSCVTSNSNYIKIYYPADIEEYAELGEIKISDHFSKGYSDYNFDVSGYRNSIYSAYSSLTAKVADEVVAEILIEINRTLIKIVFWKMDSFADNI